MLVTLWLTALGLVVGSFLNVVIARLPAGESIVHPRSRCPHCGRQLSWYENIPVLSWVVLRARCRSCKAPISARYPLVELLTGLLFLACWVRFGWSYPLVPALVLVALLIPLTFIDADQWILPFEITLPGIALSLMLAAPLGLDRLVDAALGVGLGFLVFRALEFLGWVAFRKEALGSGDKFLLALIGGFLTWRALLGVIFLSAFQGSLFGIARLLISGRAGPASGNENAIAGQPVTDPPAPTMSWAFAQPGLSLGRRLVLLPYSIFLQPIPDDPVDQEGEVVEWTPGASNLPFGPWLALAALELLLVGPWLAANFPLAGTGWLLYGAWR